MPVLFDDALPALIQILKEWGGGAFVERGTVLRDATGLPVEDRSRASG